MFTTTLAMNGLRITLSFFNLGFVGFGFVVRFVLGFVAGFDADFGFVFVLRLFAFGLGLSLDILANLR
jgi:hypothetical protein